MGLGITENEAEIFERILSGEIGSRLRKDQTLYKVPYDKANIEALRSGPVKFYEDIPSETWLEGKISNAINSPRNEFGVPKMGSITGYFKNDVMVPVRWLKDLKGQRGEQEKIRQEDLDAIRKIMRETGKLPLTEDGRQYVPYIEVGYDGVPWVSEGNHRIMAAAAEGFDYLPVEIRYFDGGQRRAGKFAPSNLQEITDRLAKESQEMTDDQKQSLETDAQH
ncbi:hypothetical protein EB118_22685 [bacterium]|nr:hypothetical protein [bacterium]